jgi:hypothetical protein
MPTEKRPFGFDPFSHEIEEEDYITQLARLIAGRRSQWGWGQTSAWPSWERQVVHPLKITDPFFDAVGSIMEERSTAIADSVVQGSLAYLHAESFPVRIKRFIPIDIYTEDSARGIEIDELTGYFKILCRILGLRLIAHPDTAYSSLQRRAAIETRPMSGPELNELEGYLSTLIQQLDGVTDGKVGPTRLTDSLELQKTVAEIIELQAEADLVRAETEKTNAETEKIRAEISKAKSERVLIAMEAFNKFATAILKVGAVVSLSIGLQHIVTSKDETTVKPTNAIHVQKTTKVENIKRLAEFLEKIEKQEEEFQKAAGPE